MPVYEYACSDHGPFEVVRPMSEFRAPAPCPECASPGSRVLSSPNLQSMARSEVIARDRNEKSRHEPRVASCAHGHRGCAGHHDKPGPAKPAARPKLQAYRGPRPWVVEHS